MEHPEFKFEQKVSFNEEIRKKTGETIAHVVSVYSPSQRKKLDADYRVILPTGQQIDVKETDLKVA
jgi:hypothetical protein